MSGALARFADLRNEHTDRRRQGSASFVIVAHQAPGPLRQKWQCAGPKTRPPSTGRRGNRWDNRVAKSFFSTLRNERTRKITVS
ncbi:hypothetical protein CWM58_03470 [Klebsiella sp. H-Nf2]|nr:hypothetical protein [Klebsiella variicola]PJR52208.1 hypothetical protein CWM58_03470 [Klebsiella sp. H-Nf2]PJX44882.1 hypothetical protein CWM62_03090 [Klebsiella sp. C-Nf10]PJX54930.1 hypothetical protein CWM54_05240 [Klebsiella sp. D-Nf1]